MLLCVCDRFCVVSVYTWFSCLVLVFVKIIVGVFLYCLLSFVFVVLLHIWFVFVFLSLFFSALCFVFFFCKQKPAYEVRIGDWSSDVCSSDLLGVSTTTPACSRRNNCRLAVIVASSGWESAVLHLHHVGGHLARLVHHPPLDVAGGRGVYIDREGPAGDVHVDRELLPRAGADALLDVEHCALTGRIDTGEIELCTGIDLEGALAQGDRRLLRLTGRGRSEEHTSELQSLM